MTDIPIDALPAALPMTADMQAWMLVAIACVIALLWIGGLEE